jgi:hypothetical protein
MLYPLSGANQREARGGLLLSLAFLDDFLAFFDQACHAFADLRSGGGFKKPQTLVQACRLGFGLPQMDLEQSLQLLGVSGFDHLGKGFR